MGSFWHYADFLFTLKSLSHQAILLVILALGSARNPHVLRVRSGIEALSVSKLTASITPAEKDSTSLSG